MGGDGGNGNKNNKQYSADTPIVAPGDSTWSKNKKIIKKAPIHVRFLLVIFCGSRVYFALFRAEPFLQSLCTCAGNECPVGQSTGESR